MEEPNQPILAYTTVGSMVAAERLANSCVENRVAACVSIVPGVKSIYYWKGSIQNCEELQLVIKTTTSRRADLEALMKREHPYEIYELIILNIVGGSKTYLDWVAASVK